MKKYEIDKRIDRKIDQKLNEFKKILISVFRKEVTDIYNECWLEVKERIEKLEGGEK